MRSWHARQVRQRRCRPSGRSDIHGRHETVWRIFRFTRVASTNETACASWRRASACPDASGATCRMSFAVSSAFRVTIPGGKMRTSRSGREYSSNRSHAPRRTRLNGCGKSNYSSVETEWGAHACRCSAPSSNTCSRLQRFLESRDFPRPVPVGEAPTGAAEGGCAPHAKHIPHPARWQPGKPPLRFGTQTVFI